MPKFPLSDTAIDGVYIDDALGVAGTDWPIGTPRMPVSNLTDAFAIATARGLRHFYILHGTFSLPSNISSYVFVGLNEENARINLNSKITNVSTLKGLWVAGANLVNSSLFIKDCRITDDLILFGPTNMENIVCWGSYIKVGEDFAQILIDGGIFEEGSFLDFNNFEANCELNNVSGQITIRRMSDAGSSLYIFSKGLSVIIQNTCTAGTIYVFGDTKITDNSAGVTVEDYTNKPRPEVPVSINAINASETNFLNLATAGFHYTIDDLVLKCADPGANTVNVRLYKLVNGVLANTQTFAITTANFATYFDFNTMFGLKSLAGDNIKITVQATAGGPYAVTGSYTYRSA